MTYVNAYCQPLSSARIKIQQRIANLMQSEDATHTQRQHRAQ